MLMEHVLSYHHPQQVSYLSLTYSVCDDSVIDKVYIENFYGGLQCIPKEDCTDSQGFVLEDDPDFILKQLQLFYNPRFRNTSMVVVLPHVFPYQKCCMLYNLNHSLQRILPSLPWKHMLVGSFQILLVPR
jgi:hypothetical protein